ncbi:MAG: hypothetical protein K2X27_23755 [Candidatus Obscuribacterales bacterium]|nr:hypothetical protein [Candidatus Obscuribacterales bacterium]
MKSESKANYPMEQPSGLCDLIGLGFRLWRQNLPVIFRAVIIPNLILFSASAVFQWAITYGFSSVGDFQKIIGTVVLIALASVAYLGAGFFYALRQLALVRYLTGFAETFEAADIYARKRWLDLFGLYSINAALILVFSAIWGCIMGLSAALTAAAGPLGAVVGSVGIAIAVFGLVLTVCVAMLFGLMGVSVLACEEGNFAQILNSTFRWTFKYFGRALCFSGVYYIVLSAVSVPVSIPIVIASATDVLVHQVQAGAAGMADYKISLLALIFEQFWEGLCSLLLRPVLAISYGLFYLDLRQRVDGIDLMAKIKALKAAYIGAADGPQGY